ncbi:MAG: hypothetical protein ACI9NQ_001238 [Paracoccaceae bacterium]|jgi:hypothetical protein
MENTVDELLKKFPHQFLAMIQIDAPAMKKFLAGFSPESVPEDLREALKNALARSD